MTKEHLLLWKGPIRRQKQTAANHALKAVLAARQS
jgi:hypothetical protein